MIAPEPAATLEPAEVLGTVEAIYLAPAAGGPMQAVEQALAVAGRGLEGDRYFHGVGTYSATPGTGRHLTMIDATVLEALASELGLALGPGESRRNLVVRGVELLTLVGRRVWVGEALCEGVRDCPPCSHLEQLTRPGVLKALVGRGGLRLHVLRSGVIRRGDPIRAALAPPECGAE